MLLIPAIDLKEGRCVRLRQGRMEDATVFGEDPVAVAREWAAWGARRLHLVDLDGAFAGRPVNRKLVEAICAAVPELPIQIGGGIRSLEIAAGYLDAGTRWVIIGTQAIRDPEFVALACERYPGRVIVALDARDGRVAAAGWSEQTELAAAALARRFETAGVDALLYTDIARDGMLGGLNLDATIALAEAVRVPVIASGGVSRLEDVRALRTAAEACSGSILGAVSGRALYEGTLDFAAAQRLLDDADPRL